MIAIDLRTVMLMSSIMLAVMAIVLYSVYRNLPANISGPGHWSLGALLFSVSTACIGLREGMPETISVLSSDTMLLCSFGFWLTGVQAFFGRKPTYLAIAVGIVLTMACVAWGLLIRPSYHVRLVAMIVLILVLSGAQLKLIVQCGVRHFASYFLILVLSALIGALAVRSVTIVLSGHITHDVFSNTLPQVVFVAVVNFSTMLLAVGFVMLATHRMNLELAWLANRDPLTGSLNRRAFSSAYEQARRHAQTSGDGLTMLILDLDHFKAINDQYGHLVGDQVLIDFCRRVQRALGDNLPFARIGGEEFALILPGRSQVSACELAERIRASVAQTQTPHLPCYTCSIGIATMPHAMGTLEQLMHGADTALYLAKCAGRNRVEVALADAVGAAGVSGI